MSPFPPAESRGKQGEIMQEIGRKKGEMANKCG